MFFIKILLVYVFYSLSSALERNKCDIQCSFIHDPVCGVITAEDGTKTVEIYQNLCMLLHAACIMKTSKYVLLQAPDELCNLKKETKPVFLKSGRRAPDFTIVGAHQACNHTCPTYCVDTYDPVCAVVLPREPIPEDGPRILFRKPMINHCHVDLLSCTFGFNVTISSMAMCYKDPPKLLFMQQVAGLKNLGLVDEDGEYERLLEARDKAAKNKIKARRRLNLRRFLGYK